jgi:hypothetical protein
VEQDPLMSLGDTKNLACLRARQSFNIPQSYYLALPIGQVVDGRHDQWRDSLGKKPVVDVAPGIDRVEPGAATVEAAGIDGTTGRADADRAVVEEPSSAGPVGTDTVEPGLKGRATLEAIQAADYREPSVLGHILGAVPVSDEGEGEADQPRVIPPDQLTERDFVARPKALEQLSVLGHEVAA